MSEEIDEDEAPPCPVCKVKLAHRCIASKSTDEVDWAKYQAYCTECGYLGETWEII